ncbi:MAG: NAD+ synthase [Chloracidobacterium sp.]|nr:NAD+ synthase [Chloracidobacterium sp.]MBK9437994.1 NAD+ synthase [Chloracidobacterium sp.]MBK9765572.1 NAD+ synthase [Chloracidobacterium sp.]MBL0242167.1 NAD+ synthase [Chloracidobacterium sp.]MBP9936772.1 NAD+ synthase [Pyrinomonadaceae bacterium]
MKVTIAQINTTNGDIAGNVAKIVAAIEKAKSDGSDLVVFPEVATHGYTSQDWFQDADIINASGEALETIIDATSGITAVVGTIRPNVDRDGRRLFNSAAVIYDRQLLGFADKTLLPEYDVFDDPRYFEPSDHRRIFDINGIKLGVVVCEDFWNDKTFWKERLYESDPTDEVIGMGADIIVSVNASPYNKGKIKLRCDMVAHRAKLQKKPIVFVNLVGGNDGIIFDGASLIADEEGDIILQATAFEEFVETVELDVHKPDARGITGGEIDSIHRALVLGIRDYAVKNGFKKAVIGLSGGMDSSLVAALAAEAIGPDNLLCVMMPSPFSSEGSIKDSEELIRNLGCQSRIESISDTFYVLLRQMNLHKPTKGGESLAAENMQSRLRGVILMAISNAEGHLLLTTGNKSELAVGYCTLYGDTNGGLAVLGDVLKTEVWQIARQINKNAGREVIPEKIIDKKPSAELAPNQFDQDSLPPYEVMDPILKMYFEQKASPAEIIAAGHDPERVYWILNKVENPANEFKRQQLPPTLIISKNAIGVGRRRPITHKYRRRFVP